MAMRKVAISVPDDLLEQADRLARKLGTSRSGLISALLARAAKEARDREIGESWDRALRGRRARRDQVTLARLRARGEVLGEPEEDW